MDQKETADPQLGLNALLSAALQFTGFEVCEWEPDEMSCDKCGKDHVQMYFGNHSYWDSREGEYLCSSCVVDLYNANRTCGQRYELPSNEELILTSDKAKPNASVNSIVRRAFAVQKYEPTLKDHELMLWLFITGNGRWESNTKELCFEGIRYICSVDLVGLPELTDHTRERLRDFHRRMKSA